MLDTEADRDALLEYTNSRDVMTRPIWRLMSRLPMFQHCQHDGLENSRWLEARVVIDRVAASHILQGVLDAMRASGSG